MRLIKIVAFLVISHVAVAENIYIVVNPEDIEEKAILYPKEDSTIWEMHYIDSFEQPIKVLVNLSNEQKNSLRSLLKQVHPKSYTCLSQVLNNLEST